MIVLSLFSFALPQYNAYNENQYGNLNYIEGNNANILIGDSSDFVICVPFVIGQDGYITSYAIDGTSTGYTRTCISNDFTYPTETECTNGVPGYYIFEVPHEVGTPFSYKKFTKGETVYFCLQDNGISHPHTMYGVSTTTYGLEDQQELFSNIAPTSVSTDHQLKTPNGYYKVYRSYDGGGGIYTSFEAQEKVPKNFQYCMQSSTSAVENCYSVYGQNNQRADFESDDAGNKKGQMFQWKHEDTDISTAGMWGMWGAGTSGTETLRLNVIHYDKDTGTITPLFSSGNQPYAGFNKGNFTFYNYTSVPSNLTLIKDEFYIIDIACSSGCTGGTDVLYVASTDYKATNDYWQWGFQDNTGHATQRTGGVIYNTTNKDALFLLETTDTIWLADDTLAEVADIENCPLESCLFYDDFLYADNFDLSTEDYEDYPESAVIKDTVLYLNSSIPFSIGLPIISHDFYVDDYNYDYITEVIQFDLNQTTTPTGLTYDNQPMAYRWSLLCDYSPATIINAYFIKDDEWTGSENRTVMNIYIYPEGSPILLGTFTIDNGEYVAVKSDYYLKEQEIIINVLREQDVTTGFIPDQTFRVDFTQQCSQPTGFQVARRDLENPVNIEFLGVDKIFYYGTNYDTTTDDYDFLYGNETTQEDATVKGEIGEELHNAFFSVGFKTVATKFFGWILLIGLALFLLLSSKAPHTAKTIGAVFVILTGIITGWYLKFVPTVVFTFLIFFVAVAGAVVFVRLFKESA